MKKILLIMGLILILATGCYYWPPVKGVKKYGLDNCDGLTFGESVNNYLKDAIWERKDKDTYIVKGTGMYRGEDNNIELEFKLDNEKKIEIKKFYVNNLDRLDKANYYLYPSMCPNNNSDEYKAISCSGNMEDDGTDFTVNLIMEQKGIYPEAAEMSMTADIGIEFTDDEFAEIKRSMKEEMSHSALEMMGLPGKASINVEKVSTNSIKIIIALNFKDTNWEEYMEQHPDEDPNAENPLDVIKAFKENNFTCKIIN